MRERETVQEGWGEINGEEMAEEDEGRLEEIKRKR